MLLDETIKIGDIAYTFAGEFDPKFQPAVNAFLENYRVEEEIGSAAALLVDGEKVIDVWAGYRDEARTEPWQRDTIVCMMSVAKGISGIAFNILIDLGLVDPEAPVAQYWPEFAQNGKEGLLVRHVLDHTAGLPVVLDPLFPGAIFDCDVIVKALEKQAPIWAPGTVAAYHIHTQGNILGEIVRRITGKRYPQFIHDELIAPLKLDYRIGGLTEADRQRCAELVPTIEGTLFARKDNEPDSLLAKGFLQHPKEPMNVTLNSAGWRQSEIASANGHGTARSVAAIYGMVARGGELDGVRIMRPETIRAMTTEQHNQTEQMQQRPYHQARGILLNTPQSVWMGPNPRAFGHHGFGGAIGFGDPDAKIGFSYACNKMHTRPDNGPRARRIIEAVYSVL
ncbi:CubicO group peptidase (beta-lactamase class C family) [Neorhizobium sp. 2083]|uniref:serine hydrolase domain-containing protein n=1 Tax=Neorhizobium sp. 2083 TaxID=2817762 RepID=UPI000DE0F2D4|nr:serine hydrolase domain-containing protein [Neorhizobium sp. 2083]MDR6820919.1 CubicO group peptidase (beta-lactamase class C family) [Neorhizobium sp. 2083]